jgi:hypothetical protein
MDKTKEAVLVFALNLYHCFREIRTSKESTLEVCITSEIQKHERGVVCSRI